MKSLHVSISLFNIIESLNFMNFFQIASAKEKIATIDRQKEYLENNLAEAEGNLREMVQARP